MRTIAFFNSTGRVGNTSLVYHLAWMFAEQGHRVLVADLDPQANLTAMFLEDDRLAELWDESSGCRSVLAPMLPLLQGDGGVADPYIEHIEDIGLLVGDLDLAGFDDELSQQWPRCLAGEKRAFQVTGAFGEVIVRAAAMLDAEIVLIDVGPNLGAINRAALIAADQVVVPLAPDLFSIKGLEILGPRLREWRQGWKERLEKAPSSMDYLPPGTMSPVGYVIMQHAVRLDRPVRAYERWMTQIPRIYRTSVLGEREPDTISVTNDPYCLALVKQFRSLMSMAMEARKPMFHLKPSDGALGAHSAAVQDAYKCFSLLAKDILAQELIITH